MSDLTRLMISEHLSLSLTYSSTGTATGKGNRCDGKLVIVMVRKEIVSACKSKPEVHKHVYCVSLITAVFSDKLQKDTFNSVNYMSRAFVMFDCS